MKTIKEKDFLNIISAIHNDKYNYSYTKYTNMRTKIIIECPTHGKFEQLAKAHKDGQGWRY